MINPSLPKNSLKATSKSGTSPVYFRVELLHKHWSIILPQTVPVASSVNSLLYAIPWSTYIYIYYIYSFDWTTTSNTKSWLIIRCPFNIATGKPGYRSSDCRIPPLIKQRACHLSNHFSPPMPQLKITSIWNSMGKFCYRMEWLNATKKRPTFAGSYGLARAFDRLLLKKSNVVGL